MKIIFVCLGNICRSPLAEFIAKREAAARGCACEISSAGTSGWHDGEGMHARSAQILRREGVDFAGFISHKLSARECEAADLICVMDAQNAADVAAIAPDCAGKIVPLGALAGKDEIADPWYTGDFESTYADLCAAISALFDKHFQ